MEWSLIALLVCLLYDRLSSLCCSGKTFCGALTVLFSGTSSRFQKTQGGMNHPALTI